MGLEVGEHFAEFGVVGSECRDIIPHGELGEAGVEDACLEVLDLNGAHGRDAVENIREKSTASAGEKMHRVFWGVFHIVVLS